MVVLETHSNLVVRPVSRAGVLQRRYCAAEREISRKGSGMEAGQVGIKEIVNLESSTSSRPDALAIPDFHAD